MINTTNERNITVKRKSNCVRLSGRDRLNIPWCRYSKDDQIDIGNLWKFKIHIEEGKNYTTSEN